MAALPNIDGAVRESSVSPFLVPRRKVWLTPAAGVPRAVTLPIYQNAILGRKVNFAPGKILSRARAAENVYVMYQPRKRPNIVRSLLGFR